ncbi:uncharacterized protein LOC144624523 [Crassostrea virginica]
MEKTSSPTSCANNAFISNFLGFSAYISNTTNKADGTLCFRDINYNRDTIPNPVNISCPTIDTSSTTTTGLVLHILMDIPSCQDSGMYGTDCSTTFPDRCLSGLCNLEDGICFDCIAGYKGQSCDEDIKYNNPNKPKDTNYTRVTMPIPVNIACPYHRGCVSTSTEFRTGTQCAM